MVAKWIAAQSLHPDIKRSRAARALEEHRVAELDRRKLSAAPVKPAAKRQPRPTCSEGDLEARILAHLCRMRGGETLPWFIHDCRRDMIALGLIDVVLREDGIWIGDRINAAGLCRLEQAHP